jgi:hypothetical protein
MAAPPMSPIIMKLLCHPTVSMSHPAIGAKAAVPMPPAAQRIPIPNPRRRLNHPLMEAIRGTIPKDCVRERNTPKNRKKCQSSVMRLSSSMLIRYSVAAANSMMREPYRSPNHPVIGAYRAPKP